MVRKILSHARGNVVAYAALFIALSGTAFAAAASVPANSVGTAQLKNRAVTGAKVATNTLTGANINESTLGVVPNAQHLGGLALSAFQRRITTACPSGNAIQAVAASGSPTCQPTSVSQMMGGSGANTIAFTRFLAPEGLSVPSSSEQDELLGTSGVAATAGNLQVQVSTPPGTGNSWDFKLLVNDNSLSPSCAISGGGQFCSDTFSLALPANSRVVLVATATGTPAPTRVTFGWTDTT